MVSTWESEKLGDASVQDIAVIGLSCRFPGEGSSPENFWDMLCEGRSSARKVPKDRWHNSGYYHNKRGRRNTVITQQAHFLDSDVAAFDAEFFHISQTEAQGMDPQQRIMLEVAYETFENAGLPIEAIAGTKTACFVGAFTSDWREMQLRDVDSAPAWSLTGNGIELLANRISWFFDLRGPSVTVETACSASMVGLHLACQSLRLGEASMALVNGANLLLSPEVFTMLSNQSFLSPEGLCKSFDASGNGYGRGEGVASILLKPVKDAIRDGDLIRAVIRASGTNQDGKTPTVTMPNGKAQADLIRATYQSANLEPWATHYCEAHGTGTAAGDPAELSALAETLCNGRDPSKPLYVGSVKANIGHLESVAGLAGIIKSILVLESGVIPPSVNFKNPNPKIRFAEWNLAVPTKATTWPYPGPRRASVNSFGYGGANAHVVLEDAYHYLIKRNLAGHHRTWLAPSSATQNGTFTNGALANGFSWTNKKPLNGFLDNSNGNKRLLFPLSTQDEDGLVRMSKSLATYLGKQKSNFSLQDLAHTLSQRRSQFHWKSVYAASSTSELQEALVKNAARSHVSVKTPRLGFVFTGQGAQWARMGVELRQFGVFRRSIEEADAYLTQHLLCPWLASVELARAESETKVHQPLYSQPLCTIVQVALVDLLASWNVQPVAVVGHSSGEIGAAYSLGALTKEDAWKAAYYRGLLCSQQEQKGSKPGSMMAVGASRSRAQEFVDRVRHGSCVVACVNSPTSVTVSGDSEAVAEARDMLEKEGIFARPLKVQAAYHSHHMAPLASVYLEALSTMETLPGHAGRSMYSSVTGDVIDPDELGPVNWVRNLISPVLFSDAVEAMIQAREVDFFVEIGPHPALRGPVQQQAPEGTEYLSTLNRGVDSVESLLDFASQAFIRGVPVDLGVVNGVGGKLLGNLPSYPWNHSRRFWNESRIVQTNRLREAPRGSLVGAPYAPMTHNGKLWRGFIRPSEEPWISHHEIQASILYPAAGFVAMAIEAARQCQEENRSVSTYVLRDIHITSALVLADMSSDAECIIELRPNDATSSWQRFSISSSQDGAPLQEHCSGLLLVEYTPAQGSSAALEKALDCQSRVNVYEKVAGVSNTVIDHGTFYEKLASMDMTYGPAFRNIRSLRVGEWSSCCTLTVPSSQTLQSPQVSAFTRPHVIHPTVLDAMLHAAFAASMGAGVYETAVPSSIGQLVVAANMPYQDGDMLRGAAATKRHGYNAFVSDLDFIDASRTKSLVKISALRCTKVGSARVNTSSTAPNSSLCSNIVWTPIVSLAPEILSHLPSAIHPLATTNKPEEGEYNQDIAHLVQMTETIESSKPGAHILLLEAGNNDDIKSLLNSLHSEEHAANLGSARITYVSADSDAVQDAENKFPRVQSVRLDLNRPLDCSAIESGSVDAIIVSGLLSSPESIDTVLDNVRKFLSPGGGLYISQRQIHLAGSDVSVLATNGFALDFTFNTSDEATLWAASTPSNVTAPKVKSVDILQSAAPSAQAQKLASELGVVLGELSIAVEVKTWSADYAPETGAHLVSLVELSDDLLANLSPSDFSKLQSLIDRVSSILWVTGSDRPEHELVTGLARTVKNEVGTVSFRVLHMGSDESDNQVACSVMAKLVMAGVVQDEFLLRSGVLYTNQVVQNHTLNQRVEEMMNHNASVTAPLEKVRLPLKLAVGTPGLLDTLHFQIDESAVTPLEDDEVEIDVRATGLNFRDVMVCMGQIPDDLLGFEASGVIRNIGGSVTKFKPGDAICVLGRGAHRTVFRSKALFCQHMPENMSFEEAAGLPLVHATAYHALVNVARLRRGQSVLIHAASGGVGQAAAHLAHHLGLEVYATVGSADKKQLIKNLCHVDENHIFYSRDTSFAMGVMRATQGRGVDCVLNSLSGEALRASWNCIAPFGSFVEIGIKDILANSALEMRPFLQDATFSFINLEHVQRRRPKLMGDILDQCFALLRQGHVKGIQPQKTYPVSQVVDAFRLMQSGKHQGKICISYGPEDPVTVEMDPGATIDLSSRGTYVLVGGLGGLGRSLAQLLVDCGARSLAFISRSGSLSKPPAVAALVGDLKSRSVVVAHYQCDISDKDNLRLTLAKCGKIAGVIQCAMVLRDSLFATMRHDEWAESLSPKMHGTRNLASLLPADLDFFISLSSFSGIFGNVGQSNYAAGCTFQDAIAHSLRALGRKAVSVDLGIMRDVGVLAEQGAKGHILREWEEPFGIREGQFHALIKTIIHSAINNDHVPTQIVTGLATGGRVAQAGIAEPFYFNTSKFTSLRLDGVAGVVQVKAAAVSDELASADSFAAAVRVVESAVISKVASIVGTAVSNINTQKPLHDYGVDSLVALEVANWALKEIQANVPTFELLKSAPIAALCQDLTRKSQLVPAEIKA
ncbi:hypothetical protein DL765_002724 [Monosporascus sp. GIB2]|nr:hypothetical protein DL765_002724 [Monosporascus sp. GIB2]